MARKTRKNRSFLGKLGRSVKNTTRGVFGYATRKAGNALSKSGKMLGYATEKVGKTVGRTFKNTGNVVRYTTNKTGKFVKSLKNKKKKKRR